MTLMDNLTALLAVRNEHVWDQEDAIQVCRMLEDISPVYGCHVALTGGCLYKDGRRKDADILFYRIRQVKAIDEIGLIAKLREIGFEIVKRSGWVLKVKYEGRPIDMFFPEERKVDAHGKCVDDHYPPGPRCPECGKDRVQYYDAAYPDTEMWVHRPGALEPCKLVNMEWDDGTVPANRMCPDCHQHIDKDIETNTWYHSHRKVTPIKMKCEKSWPASAVGINFVLPVDPETGDKACPDCQEKLFFNMANDMYEHENVWNRTTTVDNAEHQRRIKPDPLDGY